jgi:hypothetical protein
MRFPERFRQIPLGFLAFVAAVIIFKLWLVSGQTVQAIPAAAHDDFLFIENARNVAEFRWLGSYTNARLAKGSGYPLWLALNSWFHAPVLLTQHLLYLAACLATTAALREHVGRRWIRGAIFLLLALNPATYTEHVTRTVREGIYPALALFIAAGVIGSVGANLSRGWLVTLGFFLAWFRITREEWPWILPLVGIGVAVFLLRAIPAEKDERRRRLAWGLAPAGMLVATLVGVCTLNFIRYDFFGTTDFTDGNYPKAVSALYRVTPPNWRQYVAVSRETRAMLYEVSPAFRELKPFLEGPTGDIWARITADNRMPVPEGEIAYGWFQWAIRDAVHQAGYDTEAKTQAYYQRLTAEIQAAFDSGRLPRIRRQFSTLPPWDSELRRPFGEAIRRGIFRTATFDNLVFDPLPSQQFDLTERVALYRRMTGTALTPPDVVPHAPSRDLRVRTMKAIHLGYSVAVPFLLGLTACIWVLRSFQNLKERQLGILWVVAGGVAASLVLRIALLAWLDVTAHPAIDPLYLSAAYPMGLLFAGLVAADISGT